MRCRVLACCGASLAALLSVGVLLPSTAFGQGNNNNQSVAGIAVDAQGLLQMKTFGDPSGQLMRQRWAAAKASLDPKIATASKLRKISLNRLEAALGERNGALTEEMKYLAGLLRVRYVFYYPESRDIVLAGPAEGWMTDVSDRVVGLASRRPVVQLQDLVVALRAFPPGGKGASLIGCSIDPTPDGLAAMQQFLRTWGSRATPADTAQIVQGLQTSLGSHTVSVHGVSPRTHFAQVLVEADYRMKLIGIGLERPPIRMASYIDRASPADMGRNALQRWFFVPDYQCVRVTEDNLGAELVGDGVKLVGEGEMVGGEGQRRAGQASSKASQAYTTAFTKLYPELAQRSPVYAELRNLIDLAVAAAFIQHEDYYDQAGWKMEIFGDEKRLAVESYNVPKQAPSAINAVWRGSHLMTPIGGGVSINAQEALDSDNELSDDGGKVSKLQKEIKINLAKGQWWWD